MAEVFNEVQIRCPHCANPDVKPVGAEIAVFDPPVAVDVDEDTITITKRPDPGRGKTYVKISCSKCGKDSRILTTYEDNKMWVKTVAQDPKPPQSTPATGRR